MRSARSKASVFSIQRKGVTDTRSTSRGHQGDLERIPCCDTSSKDHIHRRRKAVCTSSIPHNQVLTSFIGTMFVFSPNHSTCVTRESYSHYLTHPSAMQARAGTAKPVSLQTRAFRVHLLETSTCSPTVVYLGVRFLVAKYIELLFILTYIVILQPADQVIILC
jgi:hypothetical protein